MASITATALKTTLEAETYPYEIQFYTYEPKFPIYPYCVVKKYQPQGTTETITDVIKREGFEVTLYLRYTRMQDDEETDQTTIENTIIAALEAQDFGTNALFSETKTWQRSPLQQVYGIQSRVSLQIVDKATKSGTGILGYTDQIQFNSQGSATTIQCLAFNESRGTAMDSHRNDLGAEIWDPTGSETHTISITYESTTGRDTLINGLADSRTENNGKLIRGGVTTQYKFLVGNTTKAGQFDNVERATTTLYVSGTWS